MTFASGKYYVMRSGHIITCGPLNQYINKFTCSILNPLVSYDIFIFEDIVVTLKVTRRGNVAKRFKCSRQSSCRAKDKKNGNMQENSWWILADLKWFCEKSLCTQNNNFSSSCCVKVTRVRVTWSSSRLWARYYWHVALAPVCRSLELEWHLTSWKAI